jgi:menaquinone-dependent protoporphyrinogen oxidase
MEVLVAYASRHGSTAGIAERIAAGLQAAGLSAEAVAVTHVGDVERYDAFVIGSAAYLFHWLKDATRFVKRHRAVLGDRPLWLFSSGPLGTDRIDAQGEEVLEATRPREFDELAAWSTRVTCKCSSGVGPRCPPGRVDRAAGAPPARRRGDTFR